MSSSTFLDAYGAGLASNPQIDALAQTTSPDVARAALSELFSYGNDTPFIVDASNPLVTDSIYVTVGLVLDRKHEADTLLSGSWAQRQQALDNFSSSDALWDYYGAKTDDFNAVQAGIPSDAIQRAEQLGYVSNAADRTVWANFTVTEFAQFFGLAQNYVYVVSPNSNSVQSNTLVAWAGSLTLPSGVRGLWVDQNVSIVNPMLENSAAVVPLTGLPGTGNGANDTASQVVATPAAVAANYNFPLGADVPTDPVALVENNVNNQAGLFNAYNLYRQQVGLPPVTQEQFQVMSGATDSSGGVIPELTLDISIVAGAVPNSTQLLYSFLNTWPYNANSTPFSAYQQAFFDSINHPSVLSSSYPAMGQASAGSVFDWAWQELFKDGALANVSVHMAAGDEGASANIANGTVNVAHTHSSPFTLQVGGTSIAGLYTAQNDQTLEQMAALALAGDPATIFPLVSSGLKTLPSHLSDAAPAAVATVLTEMFETVWQAISIDTKPDGVSSVPFGSHKTGSGGIVAGWTIPPYQQAFGLSWLTDGSRGSPDVAALSSGDTFYAVLSAGYVNAPPPSPLIQGDGGTSAASPLWASLTTQFNAIFVDQGLPKLGYYNDLLYIAAVIAPGSFNDVQLGNNDNSYFTSTTPTGYESSSYPGLYVSGTGEGYSAMPGYDLASGLGTPNGLLLARALSAIAHSQVNTLADPSTSPPMLDADGSGWDSGADQALLFQTTSGNGVTVQLALGDHDALFSSGASASFSWTSRLAQQSLQSDFDPGLATLFDKQGQGAVGYARVANGETVGVIIDGVAGQASQATLSNPYGFADFFGSDDQVRVARPVAIAETVGGQDDQVAVVRMRQVGENSLQLSFYKVDDLAGTIDGVAPGHPAYAAAVQGRLYQTTYGANSISGPGYGQFNYTTLQGVDNGDIIAMKLVNQTTGGVFWAFANANETANGQKVGHLWNYGLNTWGWEDTYGGGDHDYNDLVVQLDFTSASGHQWLV